MPGIATPSPSAPDDTALHAPTTGKPARGKLYIKTHGCQMNEYDSEKMADVLAAQEEVVKTDNPEEADIILFNTCSVREKAQEKVFHDLGRIKHLKKLNPDLLIGVVPVINLEWIQKLWRDQKMRGYSSEAVTDTILRRMPDYVNVICPQFSRTHVNFQRVPVVDTSNPFIARDIPSADESFVVIRFAQPKVIDFQYLLNMIHDSFMSRANTIVVPGGKMELAMQLIFTPFIWRMMEKRKRLL